MVEHLNAHVDYLEKDKRFDDQASELLGTHSHEVNKQ